MEMELPSRVLTLLLCIEHFSCYLALYKRSSYVKTMRILSKTTPGTPTPLLQRDFPVKSASFNYASGTNAQRSFRGASPRLNERNNVLACHETSTNPKVAFVHYRKLIPTSAM